MRPRGDDVVVAVAHALEEITGHCAHVEYRGDGAARITVELRVQLDIDQSRLVAQVALRAKRVGLRLSGQPDGPPQFWVDIEL